MKIAILTDGIWPYVIGGMQKHSYYLCKYLARNKIDIVLVHTANHISENNMSLDCFEPNVKTRIESIVIKKPRVWPFPGHYIYQSYLYSRQAYYAIKDRKDIDFIVAKGMTGWFLLKQQNRIAPVGVNIHGYEFLQKKANLKMKLESLMLRMPLTYVNRKADYVFSYGGKITELARSIGVPRSRIIECPAGIEQEWILDEVPVFRRNRSFVFIGRWERRKGVQELFNAIRILCNDGFHFDFHFIGPVPEANKLVQENIVYHGVLKDRTSIQAVLRNADVLVCPSYSEGMPNVILEGMANGCCIIATDVGATELLVNESTGWLVSPGNIMSLVSAMKAAISLDEENLLLKRNAAINFVKAKFTWDIIGDKLIAELVKRKK